MRYVENQKEYIRTKDGMIWEVIPPKKSILRKMKEKLKRIIKK